MAYQQKIFGPVNNTYPASHNAANSFVGKVSERIDALFDDCGLSTPMNFFQEKTGVKRSYLAIGVLLLLLPWMAFQLRGAHNICNFLSFFGNFSASINALGKAGDNRQTLIYWMIFGSFAILDGFQPTVLHCLPAYIAFKFIILLLISSVSFDQIRAAFDKYMAPIVNEVDTRVIVPMRDVLTSKFEKDKKMEKDE